MPSAIMFLYKQIFLERTVQQSPHEHEDETKPDKIVTQDEQLKRKEKEKEKDQEKYDGNRHKEITNIECCTFIPMSSKYHISFLSEIFLILFLLVVLLQVHC